MLWSCNFLADVPRHTRRSSPFSHVSHKRQMLTSKSIFLLKNLRSSGAATCVYEASTTSSLPDRKRRFRSSRKTARSAWDP